MRKIAKLVLALTTSVLAAGTAHAQQNRSVYTDINLDECTLMSANDYGARFACPGYRGYPLYVAEGDLRFFVSYGWNAPDEMAASQTIPQFNYIGDTLEWRLSDDNETGDFRPFATILRWISDDQEYGNDDEILIVTKIEPGNTCHVAYIDTGLVANANALAREWADGTVADFDCATDEPYYAPS